MTILATDFFVWKSLSEISRSFGTESFRMAGLILLIAAAIPRISYAYYANLTLLAEYEPPKSLRDDNAFRHNQHAIGQVKEYLGSLVRRERHKPERLAGVVFNGDFFIWVRQREGAWHIDQPIKVDPTSTERFLRTICSLSTERALIPENLVGDFGENTNISRQVVPSLYRLLTENPPRRTVVLFQQWSQQFSEVCDYDQASKINVAAQARTYGIKGGKIDPFRFFFCVHTYYAYLIKLLAVQIVHFYLMPKLGTDLRQAAAKDSDDLRKYLATMEDGGIFRQLGINNLMEGDFFGWYLDVWCDEIESATRGHQHTWKLLGRYARHRPRFLPRLAQASLSELDAQGIAA